MASEPDGDHGRTARRPDHASVDRAAAIVRDQLAVSAAVKAGKVLPVRVGPTLADGIAGNLEPGSIAVDIIRDHVADLVAVTDEEIIAAIRYLAAEHGLIAEGAGAAPLAAIMAGRVPASGTMVAVIGGRNIDLADLARVLAGD